jgi:hypothetical protein
MAAAEPPDLFDDVVFTRRLMLAGTDDPVLVEIGRPLPLGDRRGYRCPYRILGLGKDLLGFGAGADELQALMLTLNKIGAFLYTSSAYQEGRLHRMEAGGRNLGFPMPEAAAD